MSDKLTTAAKKLQSAYHDLFTSPVGQDVLLDLMERAHFFDTTKPEGGTVEDMCIREGNRQFVLHIFKMMGWKSVAPHLFLEQMVKSASTDPMVEPSSSSILKDFDLT